MPQGSRSQYRVLVEKNVPMKTRDGVALRADIYRPDAPGRFPVLLSRLPYNKNLRPRPGDIDYFVERGYGVIMQDTRGRFSSDGEEYYALIWEMPDGYDAVEWAASLPWADGNVGTMGQSYLGATQYLLAPSRPPHLKAAFPVSAAADFHQCWVYHTGGAFEFGWQIPYATLMAWGDLLRPVARYLTDYLRHPEDGPYWWAMNVERQHANINTPMYHVTSWYDIFLRGGLAHFCGLRQHAMSAAAC